MAKYRVTKDNAGQVFHEVEGHLKIILNKMSKAIDDNGRIRVGLFEDAQGYDDKGGAIPAGHTTSVAFIGALHEFGTSRHPARPWLSSSIRADIGTYKRTIAKLSKGLADNPDVLKIGMRSLGRFAVDNIRRHIESNDIGLTANKPATVRQKGGNTPMLDTGHLISQVAAKFLDGEVIT